MSDDSSPQSRKVARARWLIVALMAVSFAVGLIDDGAAVQVLSAVLLWIAGLALVLTFLMRWLGPWRERR